MTAGRDTDSSLLQLAVSRGLIDEEQAGKVRQEAEDTDREPSTILVARGLLSSEAIVDLQGEIDRALDQKVIGGHRILGILGRGGMGVVYRAMQMSMERAVALKVMDVRMAGQGELAERFLREARTAAKINHPNVVTVYDAGRDGEILYLAMELVHGGDTADLMSASGGTLPPRRAVEIVRDAALGLDAIAAAGLIHRDIKPANIFLTDQGQAKLADLGLSRQTSGDDRMTVEGELLGTPAYMSPEQAAGRELDIRSDLYALGATLFTLCTGRMPYSGGTPMATAALVITEPFPDPQAIQPTMPTAVAEIIRRCTRREPEDRFQTPQDLVEALERVLGHPSLSAATGWRLMLRTGFYALRYTDEGRPRRAFPWVVGAAALALMAGAAALSIHGQPPTAAAVGAAAAKFKADLTGRLITVDSQREAARKFVQRAQLRGSGFAAAADPAAPEALREYVVERRVCWDRYSSWLRDEPSMGAVDASITTARTVMTSNLPSAAAAVAAAEKGLGDWQARYARREAEIFAQPLFAWCLDRGRERNLAPLRQAREDLEDLPRLGSEFIQAQRRELATLDHAVALPEAAAERVQLLAAVAGEHDADVERWGGKLAAVQQAKERCAVFAKAQELGPADAKALETYVALVGPDGDPGIAEATAKLELRHELTARLSALDEAANPPSSEALPRLTGDLQRWEAAFGPGQRAVVWRERLEASRRWDAILRPALDAADPAAEDAKVVDEALDTARKSRGAQDPAVQGWTRRVQIARLRQRCAVFAQPAEFDDASVEDLRKLAALVGDNQDPVVAAAQAKVAKAGELESRLAALGAGRPLPATDQLDALGRDLDGWRALCGTTAARAKEWQLRLDLARKWGPSREILMAAEHGTVDPATIGSALSVARQLKGDRDPEVARWTAAVRKALPWWPADWARKIGQDRFGVWAELTVAGATQRLRWIAGGAAFTMGSPANERGRDNDEEQHRVTITGAYWLADSECTQELWQAVMVDNPGRSLRDPRRPVVDVTWDRCGEFMARLDRGLSGGRARLPTEAEWEYACRAGAAGPIGAATKLDAIAWYSGDSGDEAQEVRQKAANPWGLYDMIGNVDEWCADLHHPFASGAQIDPTGPADGSERVYRGGSFDSDAEFCRAARRGSMAGDKHRSHVGLRIAVVSSSVDGPR